MMVKSLRTIVPHDHSSQMSHECFDGIRDILRTSKEDSGERLCDHLKSFSFSKEDFDVVENGYSRCEIGNESDVQSIICRWKEGSESSIHGHPKHVFYYVVEGRIRMDFYEKEGALARFVSSRILEPGDFADSWGEEGRFDNMIHKVTALEESLSLHAFVGNPLDGEVYVETE